MQGRLAIAAPIRLGAVLVGLGMLALGFAGRDLVANGSDTDRSPRRLPNPDLQLLSDPDYNRRLAANWPLAGEFLSPVPWTSSFDWT